jgi:cyanophycinase-like exopeptidase
MATSINGTVALIGAGEYLPTILPVDKMLLERLSDTPRVVVLPTAAVPDGPGVPESWAKMGVEHFSQLGVTAEPVMLLNRVNADDPKVASQLASANFIYFSGGKPRYLLETLKGTASWQAILDVFAAGGIVAGCSAGAMVLGSEMFDFPQVWRTIPALGLVPGISVIPHFDELPSWFTFATAPAKRKTTVVGIDGATALVGSNGQWMVYGRGGVTVFMGKSRVRYVAGQEVVLNLGAIQVSHKM